VQIGGFELVEQQKTQVQNFGATLAVNRVGGAHEAPPVPMGGGTPRRLACWRRPAGR